MFFVDVRSVCRSNLYMTAYVACMFGGVCACICVGDFDDRLTNMLEPGSVLVASALCYSRTLTQMLLPLICFPVCSFVYVYVNSFFSCLKYEKCSSARIHTNGQAWEFVHHGL